MSFFPLFPLILTNVGVQSRGSEWEGSILSLFYWHRISGLTQKSEYFAARYCRTSHYRYVLKCNESESLFLSVHRYYAKWQAHFTLQSSKQSNSVEDNTASSCRYSQTGIHTWTNSYCSLPKYGHLVNNGHWLNPFPAKDKYICLWQKLYFFKEGVCTYSEVL